MDENHRTVGGSPMANIKTMIAPGPRSGCITIRCISPYAWWPRYSWPQY